MKRRAALTAALVAVAVPQAALADAPAPTDYRSEIVAITPDTDDLTVEVVGGDSFLRMKVRPGVEVEVVGYVGEPFLRFMPDGEVRENRASITYFTSRERMGAEVPAGITKSSPPEWVVVADDGDYSWHDHRSHWMNNFRPPARRPGDIILEGNIQLRVDGREVDITVTSTWIAAPSRTPAVGGAAVGLIIALVAWRSRRRSTVVVTAAVATAAMALLIGVWQHRSVPPETGPSMLLWALPAAAGGSAAISLVTRHRDPLAASLLSAAAAVELAIWGWQRRSGLVRAILPTDAPAWLDRATSAAVLTASAGILATALAAAWSQLACSPPAARSSALAYQPSVTTTVTVTGSETANDNTSSKR